jgi:hypothetical protein
MPIEAVKIPQNVYIEDRIIGPLTLRQIILMAVGGGISYVIYASLVKLYGTVDIVTTVIVWLPAVIFAAFALIKINDLSLARIVLLTVERMSKAPVRTWTPRQGISINIRLQAKLNEEENAKKHKVLQKEEPQAKQKIEALSQMLDSSFTKRDAAISSPEDIVITEKKTEVVIQEPTEPKTLPVQKQRIKVDGTDAPNRMHDIVPPPAHV